MHSAKNHLRLLGPIKGPWEWQQVKLQNHLCYLVSIYNRLFKSEMALLVTFLSTVWPRWCGEVHVLLQPQEVTLIVSISETVRLKMTRLHTRPTSELILRLPNSCLGALFPILKNHQFWGTTTKLDRHMYDAKTYKIASCRYIALAPHNCHLQLYFNLFLFVFFDKMTYKKHGLP